MRQRRVAATVAAGAAIALLASIPATAAADHAPRPPFEVWALDQSDTHPDGGGNLHIYTGTRGGTVKPHPEVIDLAEAAVAGGFPVAKRPHLVEFNTESTHAVISNVASGDLQILDVADRSVVANIGNLGQLHMAGPSPDSTQISAVAIAQGRLYIVSTDYAGDSYALEHDVALYGVSNGVGTLEDQLGYAGPRPICTAFTPDSDFLFLTFAAGGLAIFDVSDLVAGPALAEVYTADEVPGTGCGLIPHPDGQRLYTNSGSKSLGDAENVYVWGTTNLGDGVKNDLLSTVPLLTPAESADQRGDAHGPTFVGGDRYLWIAMRLDSTMKVVDTVTDTLVNTFSLATPGLPNPTPDILATLPGSNKVFASLRGYCPLSAIGEFVDETAQDCPGDQASQIASPGRTPGLGILTVTRNGLSGRLTRVLAVDNVTEDGLDITDIHGIRTVVFP